MSTLAQRVLATAIDRKLVRRYMRDTDDGKEALQRMALAVMRMTLEAAAQECEKRADRDSLVGRMALLSEYGEGGLAAAEACAEACRKLGGDG